MSFRLILEPDEVSFGNLTNPNKYDVFRAASAEVVPSGIDMSSPSGIIAQYVSSPKLVKDIKSIRKTLGYDRYDILGAS